MVARTVMRRVTSSAAPLQTVVEEQHERIRAFAAVARRARSGRTGEVRAGV